MLISGVGAVVLAASASLPTMLRPDGVVRADSVVALRWRHSQSSGARLFFHVCVFEGSKQQGCGAGSFSRLHAADDPEIHRALVASPSTHVYRLDLPRWQWQGPAVPPLDRALQWRVGACATSAPSSCVYSSDASLHLSTKNVGVQDIDASLGYPVSSFTPHIVNGGATDSGEINTRITLLNAVFAWNGGCETSLSSPSVSPGDIAVTAAGEEIVLGETDVPGTVGVYRASGVFEGKLSEIESTVSVPAGEVIKGATLEQVFPIPFPFPAPIAYMVIVTADIDDAVIEYDEADNRLARCYVVYP
jgi:hypothetical protein